MPGKRTILRTEYPSAPAPGLSWAGLLLLAYSVGVLFLLVKMFREAIVTIRLILGRKTLKHGKCRLIVVPDDTTACSLGRYVVISRRDFEYNSHEILTHEDAHRRFGHLFDSLFLNLCQVVLWFDPFIWLIRRDMPGRFTSFRPTRYVLGRGVERRSLQMLVIRKVRRRETVRSGNGISRRLFGEKTYPDDGARAEPVRVESVGLRTAAVRHGTGFRTSGRNGRAP